MADRNKVSFASRVAGVAVMAAIAAGCDACGRRDPAPVRQSIVLITIDTLRADRVGAFGAGTVRTPVLDRLAGQGTRFTAAYATAPLTLPAHVSMLTGLLPVEHTVRTNDGYRVPEQVPLIAETLRAGGYRTAAFVGSTVLRGSTGLARGFERFDDEMNGAPERKADEVVRRAIDWTREPRDAPFFLWVHLYDPHLPYDAPAPFDAEYAGRPYEAEVAYVDRAVGVLVQALDSGGRSRPSIVVAADHGEGLGDHGERSHGALLFDSTIRVPLIVRAAGSPPGRTVSDPVSAAQVAPTLLALAGVGDAGVLPDLLRPAAENEIVPAETMYLAQQLGWSPIYAARIGRWKLVEAPTPALYDLPADPNEQQNVAPTQAGALARLRKDLQRDLHAAAGRGSRPAAAAPDPDAARQLAALGYVSGGALVSGVADVAGIDPHARLDVWNQVERGLELANTGRPDEARRVFEAVLGDDPANVLALKFLGADALRRGDLREAVAFNERVAASGLHQADALSNLSLAHFRAGNLEAALARGREAVRADASHRASRANLVLVLLAIGNTRARQGKTRAAVDAFKEAAELDPSNLDAAERLGAALHREGRRAEARARFEAVVTAAPDRKAPQFSLALLDLEDGREREAAARLERLREGWPGAYQAQFYLGEAYRRLGDMPRARIAYDAAVAMAPADDPVAAAARRARAALMQDGR